MKKVNILSVFIVALFLMTSKLNAQTVYITETGKKYHSKNCDVAKTGKKGIDLKEAKKQGYEACKVCKTETPAKVADKPKETSAAKPKK